MQPEMKWKRWREKRGGGGEVGDGGKRSPACVGTEFSEWKTLTWVKIVTAGLKIASGERNV